MKRSKENAEHYRWGDECDGWRLLHQPGLSIIHERMPPGTEEVRHYHQQAAQFFFVLSGQASIELNGERHELHAHEGLEVPPRTPHQVFNRTHAAIEFLVISQPTTAGDRVVLTD
ncbi:cupin domain-containing protein [Cohnella nanjingensis]|uniref:Cupin domain-containing protein n=1 Tax=Cohnella nanjingensis TaxID=1387779 RepID=A0A7X0RSM3_9BACL|nr:cupin domain-containing protein [Cohnella nanjingensis]MBB6672815.1 cupin domain-containing protein [Cohnella nanjingensis]